MQVLLVMFKADGTRRDFPLKKQRLVVGRTNHCDLRIPLPSVSRQHCEIWVEDGEVHLRDLGSSNGTFHNRERIQKTVLEAGDEVTIGPVVFTVVVDGVPAELTPVHSVVDGERTSDASAGTMSDSDSPVPAITDNRDPDDDEDDALDELEPLDELEDADEQPAAAPAKLDADAPLSVPDDDSEEDDALPVVDAEEEDDTDDDLPEALPVAEEATDEPQTDEPQDDGSDLLIVENEDLVDAANDSGATSSLPQLVDDDDDPIAALEAMAESENREQEGAEDADDDAPVFLLDDDDDEPKKPRKNS